MKIFQVSNPSLTLSEPGGEVKELLAGGFSIKFRINQRELTSQHASEFSREGRISWEETFVLDGVTEGENRIEAFLVGQSGDVLVSFEGELTVTESSQIIVSEWKNSNVVVEFELQQLYDVPVEQKARSEVGETEVGEEEIEGNEGLIEIQREVKSRHFQERKRRETEEELKMAALFSGEKERARVIAKEMLKRIEAKIQKKMEVKKSDRAHCEGKKRETPKDSKLNSDRNKENQFSREKTDKNFLQLEEDDRFFRSVSPKESMEQSLSPSRSQLREDIKLFRSRFGDRIYENQNSTTMQRSVLCFSVPKGPRFKYSKYNGVEPSYYVSTCFSPKSSKGTSFGYGTRKPYPQWMVRNMHQNPAPNVYTVSRPPVQPSTNSKGFSFGISYKYYQKTSIVGTQGSKRPTKSTGVLPKLSKPTTSNNPQRTGLDPLKGHYHYRTGL